VQKALAALAEIEQTQAQEAEEKKKKKKGRGRGNSGTPEPSAEEEPPKTEAKPVAKTNGKTNGKAAPKKQPAEEMKVEETEAKAVQATGVDKKNGKTKEIDVKENAAQDTLPAPPEEDAVPQTPDAEHRQKKQLTQFQPMSAQDDAGSATPEEAPTKPQSQSKTGSIFFNAFKDDINPSAPQAAKSTAPGNQNNGKRSMADIMMDFARPPVAKAGKYDIKSMEGDGEFSDMDDDDIDLELGSIAGGDDDEEPMVLSQRRRGDGEAQDFVLEKGDIDGTVQIGLKHVAVRLGARLVVSDATWSVKTGERVAMVGANGCGKTTQLKVMTGEIKPEEGEFVENKANVKMAVLSQGFVDDLNLENSLYEELLSAVPREAKVLRDLQETENKIEKEEDPEEKNNLIQKLMEYQTLAEQLSAYDIEKRIAGILDKVGFLEEDLKQTVGILSGGWKVRLGLSKIFMQAPDVLLLDEPTNHLDLESVEWLEGFLQKQSLPMVVVSHDREFMQRICNKVVETLEGVTYTYQGKYSDFMKQKAAKMDQWKRKCELQVKQETEMINYIKENRTKQSAANARKKKKDELEKLRKSPDYLDAPPRNFRRIQFRFPEPESGRRGGRGLVLLAEMKGASHGYGETADTTLFRDASFSVKPGDKIGIVGRNGSGKSTLLRLLMGAERPSQGGSVLTPDMNNTSFFTQHQADLLPAQQTAIQVVKEANQISMDEDNLLEIMKKFRFKGDRLNQKVRDLSGGERARLAIVRMMLIPSTMLIFDEPTNHLDIPMKETLEYSIREYTGAVVTVSHDRWFLSNTCQRMLAIEDQKVEAYNGDFRYYMESNLDLNKKIASRYLKDGLEISSVPENETRMKEKTRGRLRKNRGGKRERQLQQMEQLGYNVRRR